MQRDLTLLRYSGYPFKDHWAIFIPSIERLTLGTLLQVEGNPRYGFAHNITRDYDQEGESRSVKTTLIGKVAAEHVRETDCLDVHSKDCAGDSRSEIERVAFDVPAPGRSMRSVSEIVVGSQALHLQLRVNEVFSHRANQSE